MFCRCSPRKGQTAGPLPPKRVVSDCGVPLQGAQCDYIRPVCPKFIPAPAGLLEIEQLSHVAGGVPLLGTALLMREKLLFLIISRHSRKGPLRLQTAKAKQGQKRERDGAPVRFDTCGSLVLLGALLTHG